MLHKKEVTTAQKFDQLSLILIWAVALFGVDQFHSSSFMTKSVDLLYFEQSHFEQLN